MVTNNFRNKFIYATNEIVQHAPRGFNLFSFLGEDGGWLGDFLFVFWRGELWGHFTKLKYAKFIELKVGNRKMAQTSSSSFCLFLPLKPCPPLWPSPSPFTFMPCLYPIGFFLPSTFPFIFLPYFCLCTIINTRPKYHNTLAFLLQIVLLLEMLKFSKKIIFSKRNVLWRKMKNLIFGNISK